MRYTKAAITFSEQADRLLERGLAADRGLLVERLKAVNYYRQSRWRNRLTALFDKHPDVPLRFMGFPENWMDCPIWENDRN